jgi:hypothetical protein
MYTPEIVDQYLQSKHNDKVGCYDCHQTTEENPSSFMHSLGLITSSVSLKACEECHSKEVQEYSDSKHAWTAFIGPLKPWYNAMLSQGLDPLDMQTAIDHNPEEYVKSLVTPLFPDSGALTNTGLLDDPMFNHENQVVGCMGCHGTYVVAEDGVITDGWPNTGVGRVNPDGSLGSCSSCHTRHRFSATWDRITHRWRSMKRVSMVTSSSLLESHGTGVMRIGESMISMHLLVRHATCQDSKE